MSIGNILGVPSYYGAAVLRALPTSPAPDDRIVFLSDEKKLVGFDPNSSAAEDGIDVYTPTDRSSSAGRWVVLNPAGSELQVMEFFASSWGNTAGGFASPIPVTANAAIGGSFATCHRIAYQDSRIVGFLFKAGTSTVPSDRTLTVQVNGVDTALALQLLTGDAQRTLFTPTVDLARMDSVALRHSTAVASNVVNDARFSLLIQKRAA